MIRRTAVTSVAALSLLAALGVATPASAAPAPGLTAQQFQHELGQRGLLRPAGQNAPTQPAVTVAPLVFGEITPSQVLESSEFQVTFYFAGVGAVAPTGDVTFSDATRPYRGAATLADMPLGTAPLTPLAGVDGVSTATLTVTGGLADLHDVAATYAGDETYAPITPDAPIFADAEIVDGGANAAERRIVERLYFDLLDRRADPTGLDYWIDVTKASNAAVPAWAFSTSTELYGNEIDLTYERMLGRDADSGGKQYYTGLFQRGFTVQALQVELAASEEFAETNAGDAGELVNALYVAILDREADDSGLAYYTQQVDAGRSLGSVAYELAYSDENLLQVVVGLYAEVLNRPLLEIVADTDGVEYWANAIRGGYRQELVGYSMTLSPEYRTFLDAPTAVG